MRHQLSEKLQAVTNKLCLQFSEVVIRECCCKAIRGRLQISFADPRLEMDVLVKVDAPGVDDHDAFSPTLFFCNCAVFFSRF